MNRLFTIIACVFTFTFVNSAIAQNSWVQIEAQPTQTEAEERASDYANRLEDVNGFALSTGWFAIALGPYSEFESQQVLDNLRQQGLIPGDSFISDGVNFRRQFWIPSPTANPQPTIAQSQPAASEPPDETPAQARASEALLSSDERKLLQTALQWAGFYNSTIDGAFGRGTRSSMAAYQQARGYETTGILTSRQRSELIADYNKILEGLDLQTIRNEEAGISLSLPTSMVAFDKIDPPFVHYKSLTPDGARVVLISQEGSRATLASLYEVMQTLEIVPPNGERRLRGDSFVLNGRNDLINSYTQAELSGGLIKGFTLVWPAGDQQRLTRLTDTMRASFVPFGSYALDETLATDTEDQRIDLLAGLEIRQPKQTRSGFFISSDGLIASSSDAVENCGRLTLADESDLDPILTDNQLGIAILKPKSPTVAPRFAQLLAGVSRLNSEVMVSGFSYGGALEAPSMTYGTIADIRDLDGSDTHQRLSITTRSGDLGGPVLSDAGYVVGIMTPANISTGQILPKQVGIAARSDAVLGALDTSQLNASRVSTDTASHSRLTQPQMVSLANDITVLVQCWE